VSPVVAHSAKRPGPGGARPIVLAAIFGVFLGLVALYAASASRAVAMLLVVGLVVPFVAIAVGGAQRVLLGLIFLDIPLEWDFNLTYRDDAAKLGALGGFDISLTTLALGGLYAAWLAEALTRTPTARLRVRQAAPLLVYVGFLVASLLVAHDRQLGTFEIALVAQTILLFVYLVSRLRRRDVEFVATVIAAGLLVESLVMIAQRYAHFELDVGGLSTRQLVGPDEVSRIGGTIGAPNSAGGYLALTIMPVLMMLVMPISRRRRILAAAAVVFGLVALILTFSRGGWLSLVVGLVALLGLAARGKRLPTRAPVLAALAIVSVGLAFHGAIGERLSGDDNNAAESRVPLMWLARDMIQAQPLVGIGANNFALRIPDYAGLDFSNDWLYTVHNKYLLVWAEAGLGALLAFVWFLGATLRRGLGASGSDDPLIAPLAAGFTAGVIGQMADMLVEPFHSRPELQGLVVAAALLAALQLLVRQRSDRDGAPSRPADGSDGDATSTDDSNVFDWIEGSTKPRAIPSTMNRRFTTL
jgi:hypothetical protein